MNQAMRERVAEQLDENLRESMRASGYDEALIDDLVAFVKERGAEMNEKAISEGRVKARRIQLRRTAGWRMPPNTIKVDRSTKWGNPFKGEAGAATMTRELLVADYRKWLTTPVMTIAGREPFAGGDTARTHYLGVPYSQRPSLDTIREKLGGHNLACWCPEGAPCHAAVLIELAAGRLTVSGE